MALGRPFLLTLEGIQVCVNEIASFSGVLSEATVKVQPNIEKVDPLLHALTLQSDTRSGSRTG